MLEITAIVLLSAIFAMCLWGAVSPHYRDNWFQRLGMSITGVVCVARIGLVVQDEVASAASVALYAGILIFAVGTALKVYKHRDSGKPKSRKPSTVRV